jgi:hypothetical protein
MGPNQRTPELKAYLSDSAKRRKAEREAKRVIAIWNARKGKELWYSPTIRAAVLAGQPWLTFYCPACQQVGEVDLRTYANIAPTPHAQVHFSTKELRAQFRIPITGSH